MTVDLNYVKLKKHEAEEASKSQTIIWEDPPEKMANPRSPYEFFYEGLRKNPGKWGIFPGSGPSASNYCKKHPEFEYTARVRTGPDGVRNEVAFMRYIGD